MSAKVRIQKVPALSAVYREVATGNAIVFVADISGAILLGKILMHTKTWADLFQCCRCVSVDNDRERIVRLLSLSFVVHAHRTISRYRASHSYETLVSIFGSIYMDSHWYSLSPGVS